jgi:hypothetical protein
MISVMALIILLGVVYIRKLISRHDINPYNGSSSLKKTLQGIIRWISAILQPQRSHGLLQKAS